MGKTVHPFPLYVMRTLWVGALSGILLLWHQKSPQLALLLTAFGIWCIQLATTAFVKDPVGAYSWEMIGVAIVSGSAGFGIVFQTLLQKFGKQSIQGLKAVLP